MTDRQHFGGCFSAASAETRAELRRRARKRQVNALAPRSGSRVESPIQEIMVGHQAKLFVDAGVIFASALAGNVLASIGRFAMNDPVRRTSTIKREREPQPIEPVRDPKVEDLSKLKNNTAHPATELDPVTAEDEALKKYRHRAAYLHLFHKIVHPDGRGRNQGTEASTAMRAGGEDQIAEYIRMMSPEAKQESPEFQALRAHLVAVSEVRENGKKIGEAEAARRSMELIRETAIRWKMAREEEKARKLAEIDAANADLNDADEIGRGLRQP